MARFDPNESTEHTAPSNDPTALSQQQVPTVPTNPVTVRAGPSPTHHIVEQGQGEKGTHHVVDQSYNCTTDFVEASGDQGQAFFLDPFGMHQYGNTDYELNYGASFTEQSQLFTQNPFGYRFSHTNYGSASHNGGLQLSQGSFMT